MMQKRDTGKNYRPKKEVCERCKNNGICLAQAGELGYSCPEKK